MKKGLFIVLEGPDRSGKSTQARKLKDYFTERKLPFVHTREPGGTPVAEAVRKILLDPKNPIHPATELLLYEAARAQHTFTKIIPLLEEGKIVLCERYIMSSLVYQGYARGINLEEVAAVNSIATGNLTADRTYVFDMPDEHFETRSKNIVPDRLELEGQAFRLKVRDGFREAAKIIPNTVVVDAAQPIDKVFKFLISDLKSVEGFPL